mmetsp:Transcript_6908/g.16600  ORF Transcript_6908/g.16600 Transcript_6908/m.16600 type:complete len:200 (+) Transcript_6908:1954-2553(+)
MLVRVCPRVRALLNLAEAVQVQLALEAGILLVPEVVHEDFIDKDLHLEDDKRFPRRCPADHVRALVGQNLVQLAGKHLRCSSAPCTRVLLSGGGGRRAAGAARGPRGRTPSRGHGRSGLDVVQPRDRLDGAARAARPVVARWRQRCRVRRRLEGYNVLRCCLHGGLFKKARRVCTFGSEVFGERNGHLTRRQIARQRLR